MSTFEELTEGTGAVAEQVHQFFIAIRTYFSPIPLPSNAYKRPSSDGKQRKRRSAFGIHELSCPTIPGSFDERIVRESSFQLEQPMLIVVVHLLPTLPAYLRALQLIGSIKIIIFKGPSASARPEHMRKIAEWVQGHEDFGKAVHSEVTKTYLKCLNKATELITNAGISNGDKVVIMDIGGYFAYSLVDLARHHSSENTWKLLGIVEDTENGHQKYNEALDSFSSVCKDLKPPRIYSVARSKMKMTEDYNVGKSLVRAADSILRQALDLRLEDNLTVGVIGFGKIGTSIAMHLRQQHIGRVMVHDVNPTIMIRAASHDFVICSKEQMLQRASFIFCATGNKALTFSDLLRIGTNTNRLIIASCTSADDELDVHEELKDHLYENTSSDISSFSRYTVRRQDGSDIEVILLCDGNAANFHCRAVLGASIRSVQAAMMVCALNLDRSTAEQKSDSGIEILTNEEEMTIARLWLQHFLMLDTRLMTNVSSTDAKLDAESLESAANELPIDKELITQLKRQLGLQREADTDPIDFVDSERKLIITAPRGSGKTAVISYLIQKVRNYYDFIWWFDCNDSLYGVLVHLARRFNVSSVGITLDQLQKEVLRAIFTSTKINNFLLIIDNVQEMSTSRITAESAIGGTARSFECHDILDALDRALNSPSVRRQRRRHIVALFTEASANQPPSQQEATPRASESTKIWLFLPLQDIIHKTAADWVLSKLSPSLNETNKRTVSELIGKIVSNDTRRLTIHLAASLLCSEQLKDADIQSLCAQNNENDLQTDILSSLIKMSLTKLQDSCQMAYTVAQIASLTKASSLSLAIFLQISSIVKAKCAFIKDHTFTALPLKPTWDFVCSELVKFHILRKNTISSLTYSYPTGYCIEPKFLEIYSMPSSYYNVLRSSICSGENLSILEMAFDLVNQGFNYDYHAVGKSQNIHTLEHFFEHAHVLTRHTIKWNTSEKWAILVSELHWRIGSYYLNERRLYTEAYESFRKAYEILDSVSEVLSPASEVTKWGAKMYFNICEQVGRESNLQANELSMREINECQKQLQNLRARISLLEQKRSDKYQMEGDIATARVRVINISTETAISVEDEHILREVIRNLDTADKEMGTRTRSFLVQILGRAYSLLGEHSEATLRFQTALEEQKKVLPSQHVNIARAEYKLAQCLYEWAFYLKENPTANNALMLAEKLSQARSVSQIALDKQLVQLSTNHSNLKDSKRLRELIQKLTSTTAPSPNIQTDRFELLRDFEMIL